MGSARSGSSAGPPPLRSESSDDGPPRVNRPADSSGSSTSSSSSPPGTTSPAEKNDAQVRTDAAIAKALQEDEQRRMRELLDEMQEFGTEILHMLLFTARTEREKKVHARV